MKRRKFGVTEWFLVVGIVLLLIGALLFYAVNLRGQNDLYQTLAIVSVSLGGACLFGVAVYNFVLRCQAARTRRVYNSYPIPSVIDYKSELEKVMKNFTDGGYPKKNRYPMKAAVSTYANFYDFNVVDDGKIFYAALVEANIHLFKKTALYPALPGVIIYSPDEFYAENPEELNKIAKGIYQNKGATFLRDESSIFFNKQLPDLLTDGHVVYITCIMFFRKHLPFLCIKPGKVFPVIANPEQYPSTFVVDSTYWTPDLIANYRSEQAPDK